MSARILGRLQTVELREVWTAFKQLMEAQGSFIRCQKPLPQNWTNHAIGRSGVHLTSMRFAQARPLNKKGENNLDFSRAFR